MGRAEVSEMLPLMGVPVKSFQSYEHTPGLELPLSFFLLCNKLCYFSSLLPIGIRDQLIHSKHKDWVV